MSENEATGQSSLATNQVIENLLEAHVEPPTDPATYKHQPLDKSVDEIRLLRVRKDTTGLVHCDVQVFPLERAPEYIALSYQWGLPSPVHNILVEGQTLKIRDILHSCLLELRESVDSWLWIDQICIAQANTAERNHQVGMMSRIYKNSTSVIVWLGDIPLVAPVEADRFNDEDFDGPSAAVLLSNSYFTRLWIVQEILLARSVTIHLNGNRCIKWRSLRRAWLEANPSMNAQISPAALQFLRKIDYYENQPRRMTWENCIASFSNNACENPRDKVYSVMGIIKEEDRFTVDYKKSVLEVYLDVIIVAINTQESDFLYPVIEFINLAEVMGLGISLVNVIVPLLKDCFCDRGEGAVMAVGFKKADNAQDQSYLWRDYNGEKSSYPCPAL